ncbi:hypothetical protein HBH70_129590 [Parastagonospora nodorum]|nr:hypothetical protein HBH52_007620 [Parastagonospora nodorum]KAH4006784.1 hypothetical protein HBI10_018070 [Parastagonospora nodorum]KAH4015413.1 hypothetical protein HBI13_162570 [Parastagonospora nodorum]KAH4177326.1 hypothetical protein HBH43_050660 [Parastagonospora nodorum]KAH4200709.1 hypothetical protein HBI95_173160 [Parastagonospora nodorum]
MNLLHHITVPKQLTYPSHTVRIYADESETAMPSADRPRQLRSKLKYAYKGLLEVSPTCMGVRWRAVAAHVFRGLCGGGG